MQLNTKYTITTVEQLRERYAAPHPVVVKKQIDFIAPYAQKLIAASPFMVLATTGENGLDCSPKGGKPGFIKAVGEKTVMIPDYAGNNRIDGLQNIVENPKVGLIFLIPGVEETYRINGTATISVDPSLCEFFGETDGTVKSVIVVNVEEAFIHCGRAITLSGLWQNENQTPEGLPTLEQMIQFHKARMEAEEPQK